MGIPAKVLENYRDVNSYVSDDDYICWRRGTGDNVELLHLFVQEGLRREGRGTALFKRMLELLRFHPPYHTVFGFTRVCNSAAISFYKAVGFDLQEVNGVYADGEAILFTQVYKKLLEINGVEEIKA